MRFCVLFLITAAAMTSMSVCAQPSSIGPYDIARIKQHTDFTDEWFDTILYDLKNPVELFVTIQGVDIPEHGYAELLFTIDSLGRGTDRAAFASDRSYIATLQLSSVVKRLGLDTVSFGRGVQARLLGWPATSENVTDSALLVDELTFVRDRRTIRFHINHPNMTTLRAQEAPR